MDRIAALFILFIIIFATTLGIYVAIKHEIEEIEQQCRALKKKIKESNSSICTAIMENTKDTKETTENTKMTFDELFDQLNTDSIVISFDKYKLQERLDLSIWGSELIITRKRRAEQ